MLGQFGSCLNTLADLGKTEASLDCVRAVHLFMLQWGYQTLAADTIMNVQTILPKTASSRLGFNHMLRRPIKYNV
jgi:hypothetical protein